MVLQMAMARLIDQQTTYGPESLYRRSEASILMELVYVNRILCSDGAYGVGMALRLRLHDTKITMEFRRRVTA